MRPTFLAREVATGLRRNLSVIASIVIVTMVSLTFLGIGLLSGRQVDAAKGYWYERIEVSIFLCTEGAAEPECAGQAVTPVQTAAVRELLEASEGVVDSYVYESQDQAYQRFTEQFRDNPSFADTPKEAIPPAFRVKLVDPQDYPVIAQTFAGMPGVAAVRDIREVLDPLIRILEMLRVGAWGVAGVMAAAMVLLLATTIRQVAWSRRRETGIKRVVGASQLALQLPFVIETLIATTLGTVLAVATLWATVRFGVAELAARFSDFGWITSADVWLISPVLLAVSVVVTMVVSLVALARHVRV